MLLFNTCSISLHFHPSSLFSFYILVQSLTELGTPPFARVGTHHLLQPGLATKKAGQTVSLEKRLHRRLIQAANCHSRKGTSGATLLQRNKSVSIQTLPTPRSEQTCKFLLRKQSVAFWRLDSLQHSQTHGEGNNPRISCRRRLLNTKLRSSPCQATPAREAAAPRRSARGRGRRQSPRSPAAPGVSTTRRPLASLRNALEAQGSQPAREASPDPNSAPGLGRSPRPSPAWGQGCPE